MKLEEAVIDINVLVAIIIENGVNHANAREIQKWLDKAYISMISIVEFNYFLIKHSLPLKITKELINDEKVEIVSTANKDIIYSIDSNIKSYDDFNDMIIICISRRIKKKLITFDKEMNTLYNHLNNIHNEQI